MANTLTVTIHIDEYEPSRNGISYSDPSKQVMAGDEVVFRVDGTTELVEVAFPSGSPFSDNARSFTLGGATSAQQMAPPKTVSASANVGTYNFSALPDSRRGPKPDQPGTTSGDIEVIPEKQGGKDPDKGHGPR
ncbi:MAG TPA: hypothetical protein VEY88_14910 [Archangium sp.]|nr:hypothetical protein [Archangium sp.]